MKDRIFELGKQATFWCCDHNPADWDAAWEQKFAELILTEVISTIYRSDISDKKQEKLVDELAYKFGMNISETRE